MVLKQPFTTAGPVNALFSFDDLADGTGIIRFDLCASKDSVGEDVFLTTNQMTADPASVQALGTFGDPDTKEFNFDATLNSPRTVTGTAFVNVFFTGTASNNLTATIKARLLHFDGTTETEIAAQVSTINLVAATAYKLLQLPLTQTHFASGDILRLEMILFCDDSGGGNSKCQINTSPAASNPGFVLVPFRLNI